MWSSALKVLLLLCFAPALQAQMRYWVRGDVQAFGLTPYYCSSWLNECSYSISDAQKLQLESVGCRISPVEEFVLTRQQFDADKLGFALEQIGGELFVNRGLTGKGVKIGIIDGGFMDAPKWNSLAHFFENKQIAMYTDYITPDLEPYTGSLVLDDIHGTEVWQLIGGYDRTKDIRFGLATDAILYLARTDHGAYEKRLEEDLLIKAMEEMHSMGVRLINLSLGYGKGYLNDRENYTPSQMDGKFSALSRAVDTAYYRKNMLIVVAAGNEALDPTWKYLVTPGDAAGALTVGATKMSIYENMDYSSWGTPDLEYVKPNISCFATQGTSFATPIITGLAGTIFQYDSTLTAQEIREIIEQSGNYYPYGNDRVGYGVPSCERILNRLDGKEFTSDAVTVNCKKSSYSIDQKISNNYVVLYHKKDGFRVIHQEVVRAAEDHLKVRRFEGAEQTTVLIDNKVTEIFWGD